MKWKTRPYAPALWSTRPTTSPGTVHARWRHEYELAEQEIADRFLVSKYGDLDQYPLRLDRALSAFIADHEPDGLSSVWEVGDPAYERVVDLIVAARRNIDAS